MFLFGWEEYVFRRLKALIRTRPFVAARLPESSQELCLGRLGGGTRTPGDQDDVNHP